MSQKTIMIVDDYETMRELWKRWLADAGYRVVVHARPEDVLQDVRSGTVPDLLVTDFDMRSVLNGVDLSAELRRAGARFPILLLSSIPRDPHPAVTRTGYKINDRAIFISDVGALLSMEAA